MPSSNRERAIIVFKNIHKRKKNLWQNIAHTCNRPTSLYCACTWWIYALHKYSKPFLYRTTLSIPLLGSLLKAIIAAAKEKIHLIKHFAFQSIFSILEFLPPTPPAFFLNCLTNIFMCIYCMCFYLFAELCVLLYNFSSLLKFV